MGEPCAAGDSMGSEAKGTKPQHPRRAPVSALVRPDLRIVGCDSAQVSERREVERYEGGPGGMADPAQEVRPDSSMHRGNTVAQQLTPTERGR